MKTSNMLFFFNTRFIKTIRYSMCRRRGIMDTRVLSRMHKYNKSVLIRSVNLKMRWDQALFYY